MDVHAPVGPLRILQAILHIARLDIVATPGPLLQAIGHWHWQNAIDEGSAVHHSRRHLVVSGRMFPGGELLGANGPRSGQGEQDGNAMFHVQLPLWVINIENGKRICGQNRRPAFWF